MQFVTVRHLWGVDYEQWPIAFAKIKANGYTAVEAAPHQFNEEVRQTLKKLCQQHGLKFVYQIHTDPYSEYPKKEKTVEGHLKRFKELLADAKNNFGDILLFVNSHSGYDGWGQQQREQFFSAALELEKDFPVVVTHETHRSRVLYNPFVTLELCEKFPNLKLTADLSHWFNVLERKLDDEMDIIQKKLHHECIIFMEELGIHRGRKFQTPTLHYGRPGLKPMNVVGTLSGPFVPKMVKKLLILNLNLDLRHTRG